MKHMWQAGQRKMAFDTLLQFVKTQTSSPYINKDSEEIVDPESDKLLARYVGEW